jgi:hypothetical protein
VACRLARRRARTVQPPAAAASRRAARPSRRAPGTKHARARAKEIRSAERDVRATIRRALRARVRRWPLVSPTTARVPAVSPAAGCSTACPRKPRTHARSVGRAMLAMRSELAHRLPSATPCHVAASGATIVWTASKPATARMACPFSRRAILPAARKIRAWAAC